MCYGDVSNPGPRSYVRKHLGLKGHNGCHLVSKYFRETDRKTETEKERKHTNAAKCQQVANLEEKSTSSLYCSCNFSVV